ncbi:MAG: WD40/YVTN/BNR-like repeat-containing protein, partial [Longimicrobiales bacterium]
LWINPDDNTNMILGDDGGGEVTFNTGQTWSSLNNQPTAQFYRVNADNQYPYWVYGGQQDNSSVAIKSRDMDGSIGPADFRPSAGCESAYLAFDPDNPRYQYGGCYLGQISERDEATGLSRNVQVRPGLPASVEPKNMKYRFNWNAPIIVSPFDPNVIYHGSNHVLRSRDRGNSWEEISPDLTKDDPRYQGPGGGPITNEGAGGEIYGTVFSIAPSAVTEGVIWTGSDDGLVHVTQDNGVNWTNVTPPNLPDEYSVNAIDASPHEPGAAYVAMTAYKFNDFTPIAFKTSDFGQSWEEITDGIPPNHWIRVVREDTEQRGLLYAGTELGAYVSFDDGGEWQPLQLNLPVTPITDLKVHRGDLVASTQGRAFWILDDLSPLRQTHAQHEAIASADAWLFQPRDAFRQGGGGGFGGAPGPAAVARNPQSGAVVHFRLSESAVGGSAEAGTSEDRPREPGVRLEFLSEAGEVLRTYSSQPSPGPGAPSRLEAAPGMNRQAWDLRREAVPRVEGLFVFGALRGPMVPPGRYTARLTVGDGEPSETSFMVQDIPQLAAEITAGDHQDREALLSQIATELTRLHESVTTLESVQAQVEAAVDRTQEHAQADQIKEAGGALSDSVMAVDSMLVQRKWTTGQDPTVFTTRLNQFFIYLLGAVDGTPGAPTKGMTDQFRELTEQWREYEGQVEWILGPGVQEFNILLRELGVDAVETGRRIVS